MYSQVKYDIKVNVDPKFLAESSEPEKAIYFWDYKISITNYQETRLTLIKRYFYLFSSDHSTIKSPREWCFEDNHALLPGKVYHFSNFTKHWMDSAIVRGEILFLKPNKEYLTVKIPTFSIDSPFGLRTYH